MEKADAALASSTTLIPYMSKNVSVSNLVSQTINPRKTVNEKLKWVQIFPQAELLWDNLIGFSRLFFSCSFKLNYQI